MRRIIEDVSQCLGVLQRDPACLWGLHPATPGHSPVSLGVPPCSLGSSIRLFPALSCKDSASELFLPSWGWWLAGFSAEVPCGWAVTAVCPGGTCAAHDPAMGSYSCGHLHRVKSSALLVLLWCLLAVSEWLKFQYLFLVAEQTSISEAQIPARYWPPTLFLFITPSRNNGMF